VQGPAGQRIGQAADLVVDLETGEGTLLVRAEDGGIARFALSRLGLDAETGALIVEEGAEDGG
jgi:hypothetical protein